MVEMARSYLKEMKLLLELWGEAVRHSKTVFSLELCQTKLPIRPGQVQNLTLVTRKLDDRSYKMVAYLGKEPGTKAHRLFDPKIGFLSVSRDVLFEENKGWNWEMQKEENRAVTNQFVIVGFQSQSTTFVEEEIEDSNIMTPVHSYTHQVPLKLRAALYKIQLHQVQAVSHKSFD